MVELSSVEQPASTHALTHERAVTSPQRLSDGGELPLFTGDCASVIGLL